VKTNAESEIIVGEMKGMEKGKKRRGIKKGKKKKKVTPLRLRRKGREKRVLETI